MFNSTDWNKHNAIGGTLLENWVEERSTKEFIESERKEGVAIDRKGHKVKNTSIFLIVEYHEYE